MKSRFRPRSPILPLGEAFLFVTRFMLLEMQQQIIAHRSSTKKDNLDKVDWQKFYEAVKDFLQ